MNNLLEDHTYWFGRWHASRAHIYEDSVDLFAGGVLALLAFVLALTLTFANERFTAARDGTLTEANAITSVWQRATLMGDEPAAAEIARMLPRYAQLRMDFVLAPNKPQELARIHTQTRALQAAIWLQLGQLTRARPDEFTDALITAADAAFSAASAERFAYERRIPVRIYWLLLILTLIGMAVLGYRVGIKRHPARLLALVLAVVWSAVLVNIIDLGSPRSGAIRVSISPYELLLTQMQQPPSTLPGKGS